MIPSATAPERPAEIPEVGAIFDGKFRIDGLLGQGGMAIVLAATHLQLDQRVAIKVLLPEAGIDPEIVHRFLQEGRSASKIRSEHVVRVLDVGVHDERPYLVLEYLDGVDLDVFLAQSGPLPGALAVDYLLQACEAIAEAHVSGIIHRDLKPANLFLTHRADGGACVKVLDFGISKLLQSHSTVTLSHETSPLLIMGSPHYMSPEQMQSAKSADQRSDLWALGAILHELVAGKPPFQGDSMTALCAAILMAPPPPLSSRHGDVPPALAAVVKRCLEKDPANRFANVAELASALAPLGSPAARLSATCIERVLGGASDTDPGERPQPPQPSAHTAAETLASGPRRLTGRIFGHVAVFGVLLSAFVGIGWAVARSHPDAIDADLAAPAVVPSAASGASSASVPPVAAARPAEPQPPPHHRHLSVPAATASAAPSTDTPASDASADKPH